MARALGVGLIALGTIGCGGGPTSPSASNCAVYSVQADSAYVLPYSVGASYTVDLTTGHPDGRRYAVDFVMPIGTTLTAARAGIVQEIKEDAYDTQHGDEDGNYVIVRHPDESVAMYGHLTHDGALVNVGDAVAVGQAIALSGHSGRSTTPHLHFEAMSCPNHAPPCTSIATLFRNTEPTPCGLQVGHSYLALPFR